MKLNKCRNTKIIKGLAKSLLARVPNKISSDVEKRMEEELSSFLATIAHINALSEFEFNFQGVELGSWEILSLFKDLVQPSAIRVAPGPQYQDLMDRLSDDELDELPPPMDFGEFMNFQTKLTTQLRIKDAARVDIKSLRQEALLDAVSSSLLEGNMLASHDVAWPVEISFKGCLTSGFSVVTLDSFLELWFIKTISKF